MVFNENELSSFIEYHRTTYSDHNCGIRVSQVTSNNDIHYLPLWSLVYLIHQNYDVVCHNFHADGNIIISVCCVKIDLFFPIFGG